MTKARRVTERRVEAMLGRLLGAWVARKGGGATTFADAGVLTGNRGLVLTLPNGQEFQITIVESGRR